MIDDAKIITTYDFSLTRTIIACTSFTSVRVSADSNKGKQNYVTYRFSIVTGHTVPTSGTISIDFPSNYGYSLYDLGVYCEIQGILGTCKIGSQSRIDVVLGATLSPTTEYVILVHNLNSPYVPDDSLSFAISTYYDQNIYLDR